jgi:hypothetical protein
VEAGGRGRGGSGVRGSGGAGGRGRGGLAAAGVLLHEDDHGGRGRPRGDRKPGVDLLHQGTRRAKSGRNRERTA